MITTFGHIRAVLAATILLVLVSMPAAFAHAALVSTMPADGAVLDASPEMVHLSFNEPVTPLAISLIAPDRSVVDLLQDAAGGTDVMVALPSSLSRGTHVLSWRVVSLDGHPIGGSLVFSIGIVTGAVETAPTDGSVAIALWASRTILFVALFIGVGGAVFAALAELPAAPRRIALLLAVAGLVAAPLSLWLQGLDALGRPVASLDGEAWAAGMRTSHGWTVAVMALAFLAALGSLIAGPRGLARGLALTAWMAAALSLALSGHASAATPQWVTRPAVFLHIGGLIFWIGALPGLWWLMRETSRASVEALARFSDIAPYAVAPIVISGATLIVVQMGAPGPQWLTPYAAILAAKLALLVLLFGLAIWNRVRLTKPALAGDPTGRRHLRRSIQMEAMLMLLIIGLVAGWRFTPPPRALATVTTPAVEDSVTLHLMDRTIMAMVTVSPARAGSVALDIALTDHQGTVVPAQDMTIVLAAPELSIEPIRRDAVDLGGGQWRIDDLTIPLAGHWNLELEVRVSRFELARLQGDFSIP